MLARNGGFDVMARGRSKEGWFWMYWRPKPSVGEVSKEGHEPRMFAIALKVRRYFRVLFFGRIDTGALLNIIIMSGGGFRRIGRILGHFRVLESFGKGA